MSDRPPGASLSKLDRRKRHVDTSRSSRRLSPLHGASPASTARASAVYSCQGRRRRSEAARRGERVREQEGLVGWGGTQSLEGCARRRAHHHDALRGGAKAGVSRRDTTVGSAPKARAFVPRAACQGGSSSGTGFDGAPRLRGRRAWVAASQARELFARRSSRATRALPWPAGACPSAARGSRRA